MSKKKITRAKRSTDKKIKNEKPVFKDNRENIHARTTDGFDNFVSRIGLNNKNVLSAGTYVYNLITRNRVLLEMAYRGSWIVGRVVDCVAQDMTRAGLEISTSKGTDKLKKLNNAVSRLQIWQSLRTLIKWGRLYGGAIGVIQIEGQDLSSPLNLNTIGKKQFKGIVVYDRWQLNPKVWDLIDSGPNLGLPESYDITTDPRQVDQKYEQVSTENVHHSRIIRYTGIDLPYFQAITEMMWGESVLERLWDRLIPFDNATLSAASLIDRANLRTVQVDKLREIIAAGGQAYEGLLQMFEMMAELQTNQGLTLLDKEDVFASTSYTFAGLSDMLLQFAQQLSGSTEIPLVVLFGQSPSGMNANGDADLRMYYDNVNSQQEAKLRNPWELLLDVMWRSEFGAEPPDDLEFSFTPLWQMTEKDKADIAKSTTETIVGAYENNVTGKALTLRELRDKSGDTGLFANITDDDIAEGEEEDNEDPPLPGEVDPVTGKPTEPPHNPNDPAKQPVKSFGKDSAWKVMKSWFSSSKN